MCRGRRAIACRLRPIGVQVLVSDERLTARARTTAHSARPAVMRGEPVTAVNQPGAAVKAPPARTLRVGHRALIDDDRARRRFERELEAARRVDSPCTARVLEAKIDGDVAYIVSEYIHGQSLQR